MTRTIILKLGGSIITKKRSGVPMLEIQRLKAIGRILRNFRRAHPSARLILLHGGGSFGHPLAHRYHLEGKKLNKESWREVSVTTNAMRDLTTRIVALLLRAGVPAVPLHTASMASIARGRLILAHPDPIETVLTTGGIPVLGGDVVVADKTRATVLSADTLAAFLASRLPSPRILFATDVPGVYAIFPPNPNATPLRTITRPLFRALISRGRPHTSKHDVTGGMLGKLLALKDLTACEVRIFDGRDPRNLALALRGSAPGTTIRL